MIVRWREVSFSKIFSTLSRVRLTLIIFTLILLIGIITEFNEQYFSALFFQKFGWDIITLQHGQFYLAWVGLFFSVDPLDFLVILPLVVLSVGVLEYQRGTRLAALGFLVIGPIASIVSLEALWPISNAGIEYVHVALFTPDLGSSVACLVCLGIFLAGEKIRWRKTLILGVFMVLGALFYQNRVYNFDHMCGFLLGLGYGAIVTALKAHKKRSSS